MVLQTPVSRHSLKEGNTLATRVILVRHGLSTYNIERKVQGHCDYSSLTEEGQLGASKVGSVLQGLSFGAIYSSPLKRAKETAEIIVSTRQSQGQSSPAIQFDDCLKEINLMLWEGMPFDEVKEKFPDLYPVWRDRPEDLCMNIPAEQGTVPFYPVRSLFEQAAEFWQAILPHHPGETILVVAHSGINRALICTAVGLGPAYYKSFEQSNCGISVLNFAGGFGDQVQLESVNLTAHLDMPFPKPRSESGIRLFLVRHGETDWNRQKKFQGQIDVPLNPQGREQSARAGQFLQAVPFDRAVSSPMLRPKETAEIILQQHPGLELELFEDLQEISHGLWEGKLEAEIEAEYPGLLKDWQTTPETVQMPEGENLQQVWDRAIACWDEIVASTPLFPDRITTVLVVAHDAINKAILCHLVDQSPEGFWVFKQGNGGVTVIDYPDSASHSPVIRSLNITAHLSSGVLDKTAAGAL